MLLTGRTWESLNLRDATDVVYVALIEPQLNGSMMGLGEMLQKWDEALEEAVIDRDTFGTTSRAQSEFEKADQYWGQARKLDGPRKKRNAPALEAPAASDVESWEDVLQPEAWAWSMGAHAGLL